MSISTDEEIVSGSLHLWHSQPTTQQVGWHLGFSEDALSNEAFEWKNQTPHFSEALWLGCLLDFTPWGQSSEARVASSQAPCALSPAFLQYPWFIDFQPDLMPSFCINCINGFFFPTFLGLISVIPSFWKEMISSTHSWVRNCSWGAVVNQTDRILLCEAYTLEEALLESTTFKFKRPRLN